jgi:hypothetical protein
VLETASRPLALAPRLRRVRDFLIATSERPLLLAFWVLVFWGTLLIVLFGVRVASAGLSDAIASLRPEPGARLYAYGNLGAVGLAVLVWLAVAVTALLNRRTRS